MRFSPSRLIRSPLAAIRRDLGDFAAAWERFWLTPQNPTTVCLLRWLAGAMLLYTHVVWTLGLDEFFVSDGWQPADLVAGIRGGSYLSYWWWVPDAWIGWTHAAGLVVLLLFRIGCFTPITSKLALLITISYANRVPLANFGLDQINGMLALYLAIAPCGAMYSVDAWRRGRRLQPRASARLATRLIQVHLCIIYIYAGLAKLKGEAWWNGEAIWMTLANEEYQSFDLTFLAYAPRLTELLTHATVMWELSFWALVWKPRLRPYVLTIGTLMHFGIGAFLGMWTFGLAMTIAYVAFVPPDRVAAMMKTVRRSPSAANMSPASEQPPRETTPDKPQLRLVSADV